MIKLALMMSQSSTSPSRLAELRLTDEESSAFLFSNFDDSDDAREKLHLKLFIGGDVYSGCCDVSANALQSAADEFDVSIEEVKEMTLDALRLSDNSQFLYDLRRHSQRG